MQFEGAVEFTESQQMLQKCSGSLCRSPNALNPHATRNVIIPLRFLLSHSLTHSLTLTHSPLPLSQHVSTYCTFESREGPECVRKKTEALCLCIRCRIRGQPVGRSASRPAGSSFNRLKRNENAMEMENEESLLQQLLHHRVASCRVRRVGSEWSTSSRTVYYSRERRGAVLCCSF